MAKLFFYYGTMNSGKSFEALKVAHNYEELGREVAIFAPDLDERSGKGKITSRVENLSRDVIPIGPNDNILDLVSDVSCVIIDEAQFLTRDHVKQLCMVADNLNIPVMAFGLKNDFENKLFEGSEALLLLADRLQEVKTICYYCGRKATMNLRTNKELTGQVAVGGNDDYRATCRRHYYENI